MCTFHTFLVKTQIKVTVSTWGEGFNAERCVKNYNPHLFFNTCATYSICVLKTWENNHFSLSRRSLTDESSLKSASATGNVKLCWHRTCNTVRLNSRCTFSSESQFPKSPMWRKNEFHFKPLSHLKPSGLITNGLPVLRCNKLKIARTKLAQRAANGPVWMPQAIKPFCLTHTAFLSNYET